ncbi:MAG: hypothetical protein ACK5PP_12295, partial [Acidimicrobiales bacterium]
DDRGEAVILLGPSERGAVPTGPLTVRVEVFGPAVPPGPAAGDRPGLDPWWDLPVEDLPIPAHGLVPAVEAGTAVPAGHVASTTGPIDLTLPLGHVRSHDLPDLDFVAP